MTIFRVLAASMLVTSSVVAADFPAITHTKAPAYVATIFDWTGFYVGVSGGYGWSQANTHTNQSIPFVLDVFSSGKPDGAFGGGFVGYNWQVKPNVLIGLEADISGSNIRSTDPMTFADGTVIPAFFAASKMDWFGSVRLRAGYTFDRLLLFGTGGYAFSHIETTALLVGLPAGTYGTSSIRSGWTLGAGLEYAVTANILTRVEYRYSDYGSETAGVQNAFGPGTLKRNFKVNDVRSGVSYKF